MRGSVRTRLVLAVVGIFGAAMALILGASYLLIAGHLRRTLPADEASAVLDGLLAQYGLAVLGMTLLATGGALLVARRLLGRLSAIREAAARTSGDHLEERLALGGPADEVRELGDTFDAMLDRLQESITAQRRFIANASHELRSPLTAIRTEVEVTLSDGSATTGELRAMGERVLDGADELDQLLAALMVLARSQRSLVRAEPSTCTVCCARPARPRGAAPSVGRTAWRCRRPATPCSCRAIPRCCVDCSTTCSITRPATGGARARCSSSWCMGEEVQLSVANPGGVPVPPSEVERLREPFQRAERSHAQGSGLGLSIVQAVVEAHHGTLDLSSLPEGGLRVCVTLPLAEARAHDAAGDPGRLLAGQSTRSLRTADTRARRFLIRPPPLGGGARPKDRR